MLEISFDNAETLSINNTLHLFMRNVSSLGSCMWIFVVSVITLLPIYTISQLLFILVWQPFMVFIVQ